MSDRSAPAPDAERAAAALALVVAGGEATVQVAGLSMGPAFGRPRDVLVRPLTRPPRIGDVVVVPEGRGLTAHRVIRKLERGRYLVTKGDSCFDADAPIELERVVGRVQGLVRKEGVRVPLGWRYPISLAVALWSRFETSDYVWVRTPVRWIRRMANTHWLWRSRPNEETDP